MIVYIGNSKFGTRKHFHVGNLSGIKENHGILVRKVKKIIVLLIKIYFFSNCKQGKLQISTV